MLKENITVGRPLPVAETILSVGQKHHVGSIVGRQGIKRKL
jgi:hypothetical protein